MGLEGFEPPTKGLLAEKMELNHPKLTCFSVSPLL